MDMTKHGDAAWPGIGARAPATAPMLRRPEDWHSTGVHDDPIDQVIDDGRDVVHAAQSIIERRLLLGLHDHPPCSVASAWWLAACIGPRRAFAKPAPSRTELAMGSRPGSDHLL